MPSTSDPSSVTVSFPVSGSRGTFGELQYSRNLGLLKSAIAANGTRIESAYKTLARRR